MRFPALLLGATLTSVHAQSPAQPRHLSDLRDRFRPLLVFAPSARDSQLQSQLGILSGHASDAAERDLLPIALPEIGSPSTPTVFPSAEAAVLRRRFGIASGSFVVILIGKDGGEKLRSTTPFSIETLNRTIDAMPMRQDEVRTSRKP